MVYKRDSNFEGGNDLKFKVIARDPSTASMAVGNSLAVSSNNALLILAGMVDDLGTKNAFISSIGKLIRNLFLAENTFSVTNTYQYPTMRNFHSVIISEDSTLIIAVGRDTSDVGVLCVINASTISNPSCTLYAGAKTLSLTYIGFNSGSNEYFYTIYESNKFKVAKETDSGSSSSNIWTSELGYFNYASVTTIRDKSVFTDATKEIYTLGLINTGSIFLLILNEATGLLSKGIYTINTISSITNIEINVSKNVYILIQGSSQFYLFYYDQENQTFNNTYDNVSKYKAESIGLVGDMLVTGGININNNWGIFK